MSNPVRVRFAPSPTGELTVGGARTALYNYLFAKNTGGQVLLRIEDTDQKRFVPGSMDRFFEDLGWLGIVFDGEPLIQSSRLDRHREVAETLIANGAAYYELSETDGDFGRKRGEDEYRSGRAVYRGTDRDRAEKPTGPYVIRLKVPTEGTVTLHDAIRGDVVFDWSTVDDVVLLKSNGMSSYHLAAMVDDHDTGITHVIRSEEWLPSAPKHLFIYQSMNWHLPVMAHVPVVLASDGKKMSKRIHGETVWVKTYRDKGYLPTTVVNYLALLGWNPGGDQEFMSKSQLITAFSLERVHKSGAMFDQAKLDAFQRHYVQQLSVEELTDQLRAYLQGDHAELCEHEMFDRLVMALQDRLGAFEEFVFLAEPFLQMADYDPAILVFKKSTPESANAGLDAAILTLENLDAGLWTNRDALQAALASAVTGELTNGDVFWPVRVALTGLPQSPSPVDCLWVLGRTESLRRLRSAQQIIANAGQ